MLAGLPETSFRFTPSPNFYRIPKYTRRLRCTIMRLAHLYVSTYVLARVEPCGMLDVAATRDAIAEKMRIRCDAPRESKHPIPPEPPMSLMHLPCKSR